MPQDGFLVGKIFSLEALFSQSMEESLIEEEESQSELPEVKRLNFYCETCGLSDYITYTDEIGVAKREARSDHREKYNCSGNLRF